MTLAEKMGGSPFVRNGRNVLTKLTNKAPVKKLRGENTKLVRHSHISYYLAFVSLLQRTEHCSVLLLVLCRTSLYCSVLCCVVLYRNPIYPLLLMFYSILRIPFYSPLLFTVTLSSNHLFYFIDFFIHTFLYLIILHHSFLLFSLLHL